MNTIMAIRLGLFAGGGLVLGVLALTNRVSFKLGVRNIPRRPAQTALIIVGLMLATLIITAAFATGDTRSGRRSSTTPSSPSSTTWRCQRGAAA